METVNPGQTTTLTESGIPTGSVVGFQIIKAVSGTIALARNTNGVSERPVGSGNFVLTFVAPLEGDLYLVVTDWTAGVLAPETTRVQELKVTSAIIADASGLGLVADYALTHLGGETWSGLANSVEYGEGAISRVISTVKRRVMTDPPAVDDEGALDELVLDYLGKLVALELIAPARDYWGNQHQSVSIGNDPIEVSAYPNRISMLKDLQEDLLRQIRRDEGIVVGLLTSPRLRRSIDGPAIDEPDDLAARVTPDPRDFPSADTFPYHDELARRQRGPRHHEVV